MKYKDIKAGETYNMRVKVISTDADNNESEVATIPVDENGKELKNEWAYYGRSIASAFSPITPENSTKNTESAPKYDPCRLFRKGDKVKLRKQFFGRATLVSPLAEKHFKPGEIYTVADDEEPQPSLVSIVTNDGDHFEEVGFYEIELITPAKAPSPYHIGTGIDSQLLYCDGELFAEFNNSEDARLVCNIMNETCKKEWENE